MSVAVDYFNHQRRAHKPSSSLRLRSSCLSTIICSPKLTLRLSQEAPDDMKRVYFFDEFVFVTRVCCGQLNLYMTSLLPARPVWSPQQHVVQVLNTTSAVDWQTKSEALVSPPTCCRFLKARHIPTAGTLQDPFSKSSPSRYFYHAYFYTCQFLDGNELYALGDSTMITPIFNRYVHADAHTMTLRVSFVRLSLLSLDICKRRREREVNSKGI